MTGAATPGFFGKVPALGDFVSRRLPRSFLDAWDGWLQAAVAGSKEQLGEAWLDTYLTSPLWRFVLAPGLCGPEPWTGVVMPSVDRVGRYFPLTIALPLPEGCNPVAVAGIAGDWFAKAEAVLLSALEDEAMTLDAFDSQVGALEEACFDVAAALPDPVGDAWRLPLAAVDRLDTAYAGLLWRFLQRRFAAYSLWWTGGSDHVAPSLLVCEGLPPAAGYASLLAGGWSDWGWDDLEQAAAAAGAPAVDGPLP